MAKGMQCDLTGKRFDKLTVIELTIDEKDGISKWRCICDCGKERLCRSYELTSGKAVSCGCQRGGNRPSSGRKPNPKKEQKSKRSSVKRPQNNVHSICFDCIRSAAPPSLQCIWDKSKAKILPEGAVTKVFDLAERTAVKKVISCPLYLSVYDPKNMKLLADERKRNSR